MVLKDQSVKEEVSINALFIEGWLSIVTTALSVKIKEEKRKIK